jgi:hypothetical protein
MVRFPGVKFGRGQRKSPKSFFEWKMRYGKSALKLLNGGYVVRDWRHEAENAEKVNDLRKKIQGGKLTKNERIIAEDWIQRFERESTLKNENQLGALKKKQIISVAKSALELFGNENMGQGNLILVPLTQALPEGEMLKGMLNVLAPKARVIFLVTPKVLIQGKDYSKRVENYGNPESQKNLFVNLGKAFDPKRDKNVFIFDLTDLGNTTNLIASKLKELGFSGNLLSERSAEQIFGNIKGQNNPNSIVNPKIQKLWQEIRLILRWNFIYPESNSGIFSSDFRRTIDWVKTIDGKVSMDRANFDRLEAIQKLGRVEGEKAKPLTQIRKETSQLNFSRRMVWDLGRAFAMEYLKQNKQ